MEFPVQVLLPEQQPASARVRVRATRGIAVHRLETIMEFLGLTGGAVVFGIVTFVAGMLLQGFKQYQVSTWTDRRREREGAKAASAQFHEVREHMPQLIAEIREDLGRLPLIREFVLAAKSPTGPKIIPPPEPTNFVYYDDQHGSLEGKVKLLENNGYVDDVSPGSRPKYKMSEEFVKLVRSAD